jgi:hypothetical protein
MAQPHVTQRDQGTHDSNEEKHNTEHHANYGHRSKHQATDDGDEWARGVITHKTQPTIDEINDSSGPVWVGEWIRNH